MSQSCVSDEITAAMAERLGFPSSTDKVQEDRLALAFEFAAKQANTKIGQALSQVGEYLVKLSDNMDSAGFTAVADMLDSAIRQLGNLPALFTIVKSASAYDDFTEALKGIEPGDCQAVNGVYKRFAPFLEAEDSFMRARLDCLAKCPTFKPSM